MARLLIIALGIGTILLAALPARADSIGVDVVFSAHEIEVIRAWYHDHRDEAKPGKAKKRGLPPGIAKNLARGKPLPPGIAKQYLPDGLLGRLPPAPKGFERVVIDGKVLLVEIATQVIHDVLMDAVLH